ncbi:hypothetical protein ZHAS_00020808 [Anopheles sinensis]|uniref:Uncharacterized protein n=1 Tax=Anopheles sinensis TaxID=74873 RepID=A0A084WQQ6_ANOSI|nr:hypothetical protein ZHAS_00020808 [Anopheles sinensis]
MTICDRRQRFALPVNRKPRRGLESGSPEPVRKLNYNIFQTQRQSSLGVLFQGSEQRKLRPMALP